MGTLGRVGDHWERWRPLGKDEDPGEGWGPQGGMGNLGKDRDAGEVCGPWGGTGVSRRDADSREGPQKGQRLQGGMRTL